MFDRLTRDVTLRGAGAARDAGFTLAAVITLAFGIGAVTALFTVLDGVLLKPLAYADAERTVALETRYPGSGPLRMTGGDLIDIAGHVTRSTSRATTAAAKWASRSPVAPSSRASASCILDSSRCSARKAVAGRTFAADDERQSAAVGLAFAQRTFGSARPRSASACFVENRQYEIVGVMPDVMRFPTARRKSGSRTPWSRTNKNRTGHNYRAVAKLAPGVTLDNANARLAALASRLPRPNIPIEQGQDIRRDAAARQHGERVANDALRADGRGRARAADRVRQRREPDARAQRRPHRAIASARARRQPASPHRRTPDRKPAARGDGLRPRDRARLHRHAAPLSGGTPSVPLPRLSDVGWTGACWRSAPGCRSSRSSVSVCAGAAARRALMAKRRCCAAGAGPRRGRAALANGCATGSLSRRSRWPMS